MSQTQTERPIHRINFNQRRSRAVVANGVVYLAGQVADDASADIQGQALQVVRKIDELLLEAGSHKSNLLTAQIWLSSMDDFQGLNAVWDAWVTPGEVPTRCCAKVELAHPDYRVEVVVTALVADGASSLIHSHAQK